jgi:hypothetical protein
VKRLPCFNFFISFSPGDSVLLGKTVEVVEACIDVTGTMLSVKDDVISNGFEDRLFSMDGVVTISE